jgi:Fe2+ transport system protein FeoA
MKLSEVRLKTLVRVVRVAAPEAVGDRLREMGVLKGAVLSVRMKSPFSGPFILAIGDAFVVMRKKEADNIFVEELP